MNIAADIRYALRQLRKTPGFSVIAILTLALGIGANTAMFSVVNAVLIRRLPYADADRLVMVWEDASRIGFPQNTPSPWNWQTWRHENTVFTDIAATRGGGFTITGDGEPEQLPGRRVTASFWSVLGSQPLLGRVFNEDEDRRGAPVALISYGLWQRRFAGTRDILGRKMVLNDAPYTVIGVMPRDFYFLPFRGIDIWSPAKFTPQELAQAGNHYLNCVARLKPGVTIQQARAAMSTLGGQMLAKDPIHQGMPVLVPLREQLAGKTATSLLVLLCAAACVLLISCANLANLLLARAAARGREVAVRSALGATRGRLISQFLTESLVLAVAGAVAGVALARPAMKSLETLVPETMVAMQLTLDWQVLAFSAVVAVGSGLIFGLVPALRGSLSGPGTTIQQGLREGGRGVAGPRRHWFQNSLIVAETALAVVLLTGGGLLLETLRHLRQTDLGLRADHVLTIGTPVGRFRDFSKRTAFVNSILERVSAVPGVTSVGTTSAIPMTENGNTSSYMLAGQNQSQTQGQDALFRVVSRDYFATIGARLREGRFFESGDRLTKEPVALVNETFADRHFRGQSALGARFQFGNIYDGAYWYTVVGVVKEVRDRPILSDLKPAIYIVNEQADQAWPQPYGLMIRTSVDPLSVVSAVRQAVWSVDSTQPLARIQTFDNIVDTQLAEPSQDSALLGAFAALALTLACVGLYGVLSYAVTQRTNEIGIRMALGATSGNILAAFSRQGLALTMGGLAAGLLLSVAASRLLSSLLYGFAPDYTRIVATVATILLTVAALACLVPARRASHVDPIVALRYE
jgi:predicted permease